MNLRSAADSFARLTPAPAECCPGNGSARRPPGPVPDGDLTQPGPGLRARHEDRYVLLPLQYFRDRPPPRGLTRRGRVQDADRREQRATARRALLSSTVAWHRAQLLSEVRDAALFGGLYRPWPALFLPPWCAEQIGSEQLQDLLDRVTRLDRDLLAGQVIAPGCTVEEILRLAVRKTFGEFCQAHQLLQDLPVLDQLLGCRHVLARTLWHADAERDGSDPAVLHARGHERLLPQWWTTTVGAPAPSAAPPVTFHRIRPLRPDEPRPGGRCEISWWSQPASGATRPASLQVTAARRTARRRGDGWVPTGNDTDLRELTRLCEHQQQRPVLLCAALQPAQLYELQPLLLGLEVDESGEIKLVLGWQRSLLALPVKQIVSLREIATRPAPTGPHACSGA